MSKHLILVSKPSPEALEPIGTRIQELGYALSVVAGETEVLQLLNKCASIAILVDVAMPEIKGIHLIEVVRAKAGPSQMIIALNQGEVALRRQALAAGADLVIDEPVNWPDLVQLLKGPRTSAGKPLVGGALLGQTEADTIGTASLLAHDLKSPISVIISSLEVLLSFEDEDGLSDQTRRLMRGALGAAYRQLNLVSTLVDLPRLELDVYELQLTPMDLTQIVRDVLEREAYILETKGLDVTLSLPDAPLMVPVDLDLMQRAVSSLVDNVLKFTVRGDKLLISATQEGDQIMLRFTDSGRPVQPSFEQDIMTRAPQWEQRQNGARTSVALGLPFTYAVARAHHGDFTAASTPNGQSTTFTLTLPTQLSGGETHEPSSDG